MGCNSRVALKCGREWKSNSLETTSSSHIRFRPKVSVPGCYAFSERANIRY